MSNIFFKTNTTRRFGGKHTKEAYSSEDDELILMFFTLTTPMKTFTRSKSPYLDKELDFATGGKRCICKSHL